MLTFEEKEEIRDEFRVGAQRDLRRLNLHSNEKT